MLCAQHLREPGQARGLVGRVRAAVGIRVDRAHDLEQVAVRRRERCRGLGCGPARPDDHHALLRAGDVVDGAPPGNRDGADGARGQQQNRRRERGGEEVEPRLDRRSEYHAGRGPGDGGTRSADARRHRAARGLEARKPDCSGEGRRRDLIGDDRLREDQVERQPDDECEAAGRDRPRRRQCRSGCARVERLRHGEYLGRGVEVSGRFHLFPRVCFCTSLVPITQSRNPERFSDGQPRKSAGVAWAIVA